MVLVHPRDGHTRNSKGWNLMCTRRFVGGPLSVLCICALVMGTASAVVISATDNTSNPDSPPAPYHLSPQAHIDSLGKKGVDVSEMKADVQGGDTAAPKARNENHLQTGRPEKPEGSVPSPDLTNSTQQQEIITKLEEKGVGVAEPQADLQNGDTGAVKIWLETYLHAHEGEMPLYHTTEESGQ